MDRPGGFVKIAGCMFRSASADAVLSMRRPFKGG